MKQIPLSNSDLMVLVDDQDYDYLMQWKWKLARHGYAVRTGYKAGRFITIYMHQLIAGKKAGLTIDHANRCRLDNQRHNLVHRTKSQNNRNKGLNKNNTSGFKNVSKFRTKWRAYVVIDTKFIHLGIFDTPQEAATVAQKAEASAFAADCT